MKTNNIIRFDQLIYDELINIEQKEIKQKDRPEVENKWRKLLFFIRREGTFKTISKIKSKRDKTFSPSKLKTLILIKKDNKIYANFSIQTSNLPEHFVIENKFYLIDKELEINNFEDETIFNQFVPEEIKSFSDFINLESKKEEFNNLQNYERGVFLYGLGDYARVYIAPHIKKENKIFCIDYSHSIAKNYKEKYNFKHYGLVPEDSYEQLKNTKNPLAIIATYHSDHSRIAKEIFETNPNTLIFIEKPPCVTLEDLEILKELYEKGAKIEIGYNRRFIQFNRKLNKDYFKEQKVITITVKEILINPNHWYFWENQGTRVTGNLTHWLDLCTYLIDGNVEKINLISPKTKDETLAVSILYSDGSLANITVSDKGSSLRGVQEQIEIRTKDETIYIDDYTKITHLKKSGNKKVHRNFKRFKGHESMYKHLLNLYRGKTSIQYSKDDLVKTTELTYSVADLFRKERED